MIGRKPFLCAQPWPEHDPKLLKDEQVEIVVQVNGKPRERLMAPADSPKDKLQELALAAPKVQAALAGKKVVKVVAVPNKLVNIVVQG